MVAFHVGHVYFLSACLAVCWGVSDERPSESPAALPDDDECKVGEDGSTGECGLNALQRRGQLLSRIATDINETDAPKCASLHSKVNHECRKTVDWVSHGGGKWDPKASSWFHDMELVTGVNYKKATSDDFQRLYFCSPPGGSACGAPPCHCSKPPCDKCLGGLEKKTKPGCGGSEANSIKCKPPKGPMDYKGMTWPTMTFHGVQEMHIFAIGDWGGMDGTLNPIEGRPRVVAYQWGARPGPSVFPRTRWNLHHTVELCTHKQFIECFNSEGSDCEKTCGYVKGVDDQPQQLVANAFKARASIKDPQFILNVGDNFYWGGIEKTCGSPMNEISFTAHHQFDQIFESMYQGHGLSGKSWLSVLGNHDWGGRQFNNGWDQQIAYTWASDRWVMPAPYYMVQVHYPTQMMTVDIFLVDSNVRDAKNPPEDSEHNICGSAHNPPNADCSAVGGPASIETCPGYFKALWEEQQEWLKEKLSQSSATWQIMVTHFPCGEDGDGGRFYKELHQKYGLDLLVTGHRHDQELWKPTDRKNNMGGLTCIVTGGGGGITSEATPDPLNTEDWYGEGQYGFYDITIRKTWMTIESINYNGVVLEIYNLFR